MDSGGYRRRDWWTDPFVDGARTLSWDEAIRRFTDRTGRPGPATWEAGEYPSDQADYPVAGRELVRGRGLRALRRQVLADHPPLGPRGGAADRRGDRAAQQSQRPWRGAGRHLRGRRPLRHPRHGGQRARVVRQCGHGSSGSGALHPGRRLERPRLRLQRSYTQPRSIARRSTASGSRATAQATAPSRPPAGPPCASSATTPPSTRCRRRSTRSTAASTTTTRRRSTSASSRWTAAPRTGPGNASATTRRMATSAPWPTSTCPATAGHRSRLWSSSPARGR